ncbi:hypothetical protein TrLO_g5652 [Triparma laevis f. longispina]|uniref:EF-hand domain-containing protein n=1 Tax=Triparma laevis f. longispina TaxID=1714387 RepID=A0A9W7F7A3_9STRA|nr:hypothetical protein TrLO_g5652 [Triparma laevis f. longispina]
MAALARHEQAVCNTLESLQPDFYHQLTSFHKMLKPNTNPRRSPSTLSEPESEWDEEPIDEDDGEDAGGVDNPALDGYGAQTKNGANFFRRFTAQETFDASDQHNERSFRAYDKDNDGSLSTTELTHGLLTGANFDFMSYPIIYIKLLGILQGRELTDEAATALKAAPGKFEGWSISFAIYNALIKQLKFQVLFNVNTVKRMFKVLRLEMSAKQEVRSARSDRTMKKVNFNIELQESANDEALQAMMRDREVSVEGWEEHMSKGEFSKYIQSLKLILTDVNTADDIVSTASLEDLTRAKHDMGVVLSVQDYNIDRLESKVHINKNFKTMYKFLSGPPNAGFTVRWINLESFDTLNMLRVCAMQNVHPLAVKDILSLWKQPAQIQEFGQHFSIILPCLRLSRKANISLTRYKKVVAKRNALKQAKRLRNSGIVQSSTTWLQALIGSKEKELRNLPKIRLKLDVESSRSVVLMTGPPKYDTLMSFSTLWMRRKNMQDSAANEEDANGDSSDSDDEEDWERDSDDDEEDNMESDQIRSDLVGTFSRQNKYLKKDFSFIRSGDANWLLCSMMRNLVGDIQPIVVAYRLQLEIMRDALGKKYSTLSKKNDNFLHDVHLIQMELEWVERKVKPLKRIVQHLIDDKRIGNEISHYFEDIEDDVASVQADLSNLLAMIVTLKAEYDNFQDRRVNDLLSILTFATVCILPAQFLTGLFGMNFVDKETGDPAMPMLTWKYGYLVFWLFSLVTIFFSYVYFKYKWKVL